ncbi:MAG: type II toxin-antitoxin system ParD family antitoxin [Crocinitomicaceae bacterium]|nr:type II toxin-antitoxin system ParD family antitoxin [Crocinitomicaceae bacterium]
MSKPTSFVLGEHFDALIKQEIESGEYKNASEVIRESLRQFFAKKRAEREIGNLVEEARSSGYVQDFDWESHRKAMHNKVNKKKD